MKTDSNRDTFLEIIYQRNHSKLEKYCLHYVNCNPEYQGIINDSIQEAMLQAVKDYEKLRTYPDS